MKKGIELSDEAKEIRRAYQREWRSKNKEKIRESTRKFWERKAQKVNNSRQA